jgi:signal transduction histidine kinase
MTLKLRVTLLLSLLLLGFLVTWGAVRLIESRAAENRREADREAKRTALNHWIEAADRALPDLADTVATSKWANGLLNDEAGPEVRDRVAATVRQAELAGLWLIVGNGQTRFSATPAEPPPIAPAAWAELAREPQAKRFFATVGAGVVEVCAERIAGAADAWVVVARSWDEGALRRLAELTEGVVSLLPPNEPDPPIQSDHLVVVRTLADWQGKPVRQLRVEYPFVDATTTPAEQTRMFFIFGLLVLGAMVVVLELWVLRPLRRIGHSLSADDPTLVAPLSVEKSELGQVARLVEATFAQRAALEREIAERKETQAALEKTDQELREAMDERARLGRDLHDGVIQTLYAAGMGLTGVRALLDPEQIEAAARLEQTRAALNETIHDVRNFIVGLEPEALKTQTFSQAVQGLIDVLRAARPLQADVAIDEQIAARLTLAQRVHALQIVREAVSNAVRHGNATALEVRLGPAGHFAEFRISDNGSGFDVANTGGGNGLANFAQRARELGAELTVESTPGRGTTVKLVFSFLTPA